MTCLLHRSVLSLATVLVLATLHAHAVTIPTVPIGNPGNPPDTRYNPNGVGSVPYSFRMGKFELTNAQYVEFLNAVAASDPYALYNTNMASDTRGGIVRSGTDGNYSYSVKPSAAGQGTGGTDYAYDNKPVVLVSLFSALRFANWLHNGQGAADTETGAYTLLGGTPTPSNWHSITRNADARWWLPSDDEWYKAAYYDPSAAVYYDYPTGTNSVPNNNPPSADTGNSANFANATGNSTYPMTDVGAYSLSASPYGTFDQGGNVWEWTDTLFPGGQGAISYPRGGWWGLDVSSLRPSVSHFENPERRAGANVIGFRIATVIPEPSTLLLAALGLLAVFLRRRRRKAL